MILQILSDTLNPVAQEVATKVIEHIKEEAQIGSGHIALVILGSLLYNLLELDKLRKSKKKFKISYWFRDNWISMIITAVSLVTMFMLKEDLKQIMGFDMSNKIGCFLAGFTVHTFSSKAKNIAMGSQPEAKEDSKGLKDVLI